MLTALSIATVSQFDVDDYAVDGGKQKSWYVMVAVTTKPDLGIINVAGYSISPDWVLSRLLSILLLFL